MSFITSASTITLSAYLTNKGRNFLVSGVKKDIEIAYFILGDSDTNYNLTSQTTEILLTSGNVPNLSGDNTDCVRSVSDDFEIRHKIRIKPKFLFKK